VVHGPKWYDDGLMGDTMISIEMNP
jgi:hypothetical protein